MDPVRKLILERLTELRLQRKAVSVAIGRNDTYLSQFLRRGIPDELPEAERIRLALILKVDENELRGPSTKVSHAKAPSTKSLVEPDSQPAYIAPGASQFAPGAELVGKIDLPVYGTAPDGPNGALVTTHPVDWSVRPPSLLRMNDGYGLIVPDNTMAPEHKAGSIALVNPHLPPKAGESCVLRSKADQGARALIREYRGETDTHWKVAQHSPAKTFSLKKSEWHCHKTVGNYFA